MTKIVSEVFWNAACSCGWRTEAPNDADTVTNKVALHLKQAHPKTLASISITSYHETRPIDTLPALGKLATAPPGVTVSPPTPPLVGATTSASPDEIREREGLTELP